MTTVMVVEDDPAFLTRFCSIVASDAALELFATVADLASARQLLKRLKTAGMAAAPRARRGTQRP